MEQQASYIRQLQSQVAQLGGTAAPPLDSDADVSQGGTVKEGAREGTVASRQQHALHAHQLAVAKGRIAQLEKDLAAAQQALDRRNPDSLSSLIRAAKGSEGAVGEPAHLLAQLEKLRADAQAAAEAHDRQLRALRQQHEQLKAQYAAGSSAAGGADEPTGSAPSGLSASHKGRAQASSSVTKREEALRGRVDSLEQELERVRAFYVGKVKALTAQVKELTPGAPGSDPRGSSVSSRSSRVLPARRTQPAPPPQVPSAVGVHRQLQQTASRDSSTTPLTTTTQGSLAHNANVPPPLTVASSDASLHELSIDQTDRLIAQDGHNGQNPARGSHQQPQLQPAAHAAADEELKRVVARLQAAEQRIEALADENVRHAAQREVSKGADSVPPLLAPVASESATVPRPPSPATALRKASTVAGNSEPRAGDIARLYAAIDMLEARAEARELELARAERAVHSVHEGLLDAERGRFREALKLKDVALEKCKRELLQMMSVLQQGRADQMLKASP
jgi:hypothetical protein